MVQACLTDEWEQNHREHSEQAIHRLSTVITLQPITAFIDSHSRVFIFKRQNTFFSVVWSSGQSSRLQIQRSGYDSQRYQIFREVVGMKRGPLSLVSTNEELLGRKSSGSSLQTQKYGCGYPLRWPPDTLYPQMLALTSPTSGCRSVGIVRSQTKATQSLFFGLQCS
jgi:hypothetical protein